MIMPDWQYPHCGTSSSIQASCTGCVPSGDKPSMVVTALPAAAETGTLQERTGLPSMCRVQAPHWAMPQLNLVPVSPRESRITQSSGVSGATSTECRTPFTVRFTAIAFPRPLDLVSTQSLYETIADQRQRV